MLNKIIYRINVIKQLKTYAFGIKRYFLILNIADVIIMSVQFLKPILYGIFIDMVIIQRERGKLLVVIVGSLGVYLIETAMEYFRIASKIHLSNSITKAVKGNILSYFLDVPLERHEKIDIGDLKMRLEDDTKHIDKFVESQTINYILAYITAGVCVVLLFGIDWRLAVFSSIVVPLTFALDHLVSNYENKIVKEQYKNQKKWMTWLHEDLLGWREVKALDISKHESREFYNFAHQDMIYNAKWINCWTARRLAIPKLKDEFFMQFCLYFLGGILIILQKLDIGQLLVFAMYYSMFSDAVKNISGADAELEAQKVYTDRLLESLQMIQVKSREKINLSFSSTIEFLDVSYRYPDAEKNVLENINFQIRKGERVAIIGKSGSGKSTLIKLMAGILMPTEGKILLSGIDLKKIELSSLYKSIGFVMQDSLLFNDTIEENLRYGKEKASMEEIYNACHKAGIYDDIKKMPEGLKTVIGERGEKLSGGQRQRLILARLFLQDKEILVIDEGTSGLDQKTENIVFDSLRSIQKDKTVIVVTHKEESLFWFDKIIKINE